MSKFAILKSYHHGTRTADSERHHGGDKGKGYQETIVTSANVATNVGSGKVQVFATPMMIALIEKAATLSIEPVLAEWQSSVGTHINVSHCSATPMGIKVWADTEVIAINRRKVTFSVKAYDERVKTCISSLNLL